MGKKLIIAEKPSVAADISRALGGFARKGDYYESERYVLSAAVGHLLELVVPDEFDVKRGKWSFKHLPVIPPRFALAPLERSEQRLNLLLRLIKRKDVSALVNACDAGVRLFCFVTATGPPAPRNELSPPSHASSRLNAGSTSS